MHTQQPAMQAFVPHPSSLLSSDASGRGSGEGMQMGVVIGESSAEGALYWVSRYEVLYRDVTVMRQKLAAISEDIAAALAASQTEGLNTKEMHS